MGEEVDKVHKDAAGEVLEEAVAHMKIRLTY